jgi:hypothetical protein
VCRTHARSSTPARRNVVSAVESDRQAGAKSAHARISIDPGAARATHVSHRCEIRLRAERKADLRRESEFLLEKLGLNLGVEGDLKPHPGVSLGNRLKRDRLDHPVVQPCADIVQ